MGLFFDKHAPGDAVRASLLRQVAAQLMIGASVLAVGCAAAQAFVVELKDVAPDRIERQRAAAVGELPLPNTPNISQFNERLAEKKLALGNAIFIRIFKAESELEVWMKKGNQFELFATYPICHWSGTLGPKANEGDKQAPEGVYTVSSRQLHLIGRHPRSLNLGFPNALDRQFARTGSYILIHGVCSSVGCYAMTNPVIEEIYKLTQSALKNGQDAVHVHAFPFRLTEEKLRDYALHEWYDFWRNLKDAYDSFERQKVPPKVSVCDGRYWIEDGKAEEVATHGPLAVCGRSLFSADSPTPRPAAAAPDKPSKQAAVTLPMSAQLVAPQAQLPQAQPPQALPPQALPPQALPSQAQPTAQPWDVNPAPKTAAPAAAP